MSDQTPLLFAPTDPAAVPVHIVTPDQAPDWDDVALTPSQRAWLSATGFAAGPGAVALCPGADGQLERVLIGAGSVAARRRGRFLTARAVAALPKGVYRYAGGLAEDEVATFALGWLLAQYRFDAYAKQKRPQATLIAPEGIDAHHIEAIANGECLTRDLINTPASDMGPAELETAARTLGTQHGAEVTVIAGDELLDQNFPMIHTVGRAAAAHRAPRLIEMTWGDTGPHLTLVGKGVCFDTGGLNIKPGASMGLMKKDMGGAAAVLGLAQMIMATSVPLRLRVLIPAVENAISADAFRPQDILTSRKGLTVEINNTDAEGRLVLADALALAAEGETDLTISMATLTGAARVAVGGDLAPFFTDDEEVASALAQSGAAIADPVWRLPFHEAYEADIEPGIADLDNAPGGGQGGAITAALFLRRFAPERYVHFDIYGWQRAAAPARPKGGVGQGTRAIFDALPRLLSL